MRLVANLAGKREAGERGRKERHCDKSSRLDRHWTPREREREIFFSHRFRANRRVLFRAQPRQRDQSRRSRADDRWPKKLPIVTAATTILALLPVHARFYSTHTFFRKEATFSLIIIRTVASWLDGIASLPSGKLRFSFRRDPRDVSIFLHLQISRVINLYYDS